MLEQRVGVSHEATWSEGKWGSGAVINVIWVGLWFLTFGPHMSSVWFHSKENGEIETVINKAHVFKHTHWNVLMNSHMRRDTHNIHKDIQHLTVKQQVLENVLPMESTYHFESTYSGQIHLKIICICICISRRTGLSKDFFRTFCYTSVFLHFHTTYEIALPDFQNN